MEYRKYRTVFGEEIDDLAKPRIGTLEVLKPIKNARYYGETPLADMWGVGEVGEYPLYGDFVFHRIEDGDAISHVYCNEAFAYIKGTDERTQDPCHYVFSEYEYSLGKYLKEEGAEYQGGLIRIRLNKPFGYDSSQSKVTWEEPSEWTDALNAE